MINKASLDAISCWGEIKSQGESELWFMRSAKHDQKLIRMRKAHNELAHQIWAKSDQRFACKCVETPQSFRSQETTRIQWSMTKS